MESVGIVDLEWFVPFSQADGVYVRFFLAGFHITSNWIMYIVFLHLLYLPR